MLKFTLCARAGFRPTLAALGTAGHANFVDPYRILGVTQGTPIEDVRRRFHELTQRYHPDTPTGNADKFREINAAYRQIRAEYRQQKAGFADTAFSRAQRTKGSSSANTGGDFWAEHNAKVREAQDRMAAARRRAKEQDAYARRAASEKNKNVFRRFIDFLNGGEIWISIGITLVVFVYAAERYYTMTKMLNAKAVHMQNIDHGLPPPMPMELDDELVKRYSAPVEKGELSGDTMRAKAESQYRKATQRRFDDFREFMYVYDADNIAARKVSTERFSFQYMHEAEIPKRCPVVKNFNSEMKRNGYENIEKDLLTVIHDTPWASPDMGVAAGLVAKGLGCVPANSPNTAKWTFIEYQDTTKGRNGRKGEPVCLVAIRNHRFDKVGMCQRMTITGRPELVPELVAQREDDLKSGRLKKKTLVSGGALPVKDLSVPLKDMAL